MCTAPSHFRRPQLPRPQACHTPPFAAMTSCGSSVGAGEHHVHAQTFCPDEQGPHLFGLHPLNVKFTRVRSGPFLVPRTYATALSVATPTSDRRYTILLWDALDPTPSFVRPAGQSPFRACRPRTPPFVLISRASKGAPRVETRPRPNYNDFHCSNAARLAVLGSKRPLPKCRLAVSLSHLSSIQAAFERLEHLVRGTET